MKIRSILRIYLAARTRQRSGEEIEHVREHHLRLASARGARHRSGIDGIKDVAIRNGKVAAVQTDILPANAREVVDVTSQIVLPGLIDTHAHVYQYVTGRFGVNADMVGVQSGVTTLVDQGGPSCMTLPGFRHFVAEKAKSRTYAFLSAYLVGGLEGHYYPRLYSPDGVDIDATVKAATANRDLVRGIKAHAEIGGFALGSASQIALFVAPALVLLSYFVGPSPMSLQFWPGAVTMVMIATVTATFITSSERSAWFVGALLVFIYAIFALTLYVVPPTGQGMG
jgi:hypothetical protein